MALSLLTHNNQNFGGGPNNVVTASVTAGTGPYLFCLAGGGDNTGFTPSGCGLTWSLPTNGFFIHSQVYEGIWLGSGTPTTGAITATPSGGSFNNRAAWYVIDAPGLTSITNVSTNTTGDWASVGCTITGTPTASDLTFAIANSGRDLSGALSSWSSGWATVGAGEDNLNSIGEIVVGQSVTHNQSPLATFVGSGGANGGIVGCILVGAAGAAATPSLPIPNLSRQRRALLAR